MVVAGPGSGKTFVLVNKVLNLIRSGVPESSILCMTFTEKATGEMKQRLENKGVADVKVSTFHAFSKELIEENLIESGIGHGARVFDRPLQIAWCLRNTDRFKLDPRYINVGRGWNELYSAVLEAISRFKQEMISHNGLQELIDLKMSAFEPPGDLKSADAKQDDDGQIELVYRLNELNKVYRQYEEYKDEQNFIDFEDMVYRAAKLLTDNEVLRNRYQKKFQHIMIDEFQDNNYTQLELVKILGEHQNVTVVGDGDQAIMGFQGAHQGAFEDFERDYPNHQRIELATNYRSTKNIIAVANQILGRTEEEHTENEAGEKIAVVCTDTDGGEAEYIARTVRDLIGKPVRRCGSDERQISYRDIAVLSRRKRDGYKFAHALKSLGIPATFIGNTDIRANQIILEIVAYLKVIHSPATSGMEIFRLLKKHGISEQNIIVVNGAARRTAGEPDNRRDDCVLKTMREYSGLDITQKQAVLEIAERLDNIIKKYSGTAISETVRGIMMEESGVYKKLVDGEGLQDRKSIRVLNKFYKMAKEYQDVFPDHGIGDFLQYLPVLGHNGIEAEDDGPDDAVNVMTMHKSKGKEFPVVFIPDVADRRFPVRYSERLFGMPEGLSGRVNKTGDSKEAHDDEERRLFYVSATRAMNRLYIMYPGRYEQNVTESKPSRFLTALNYETNPRIDFIRFAESGQSDIQGPDPKEHAKAEKQRQASEAIYGMHPKAAILRIVELAWIEHCEKFGTSDGFDPKSILDVDMEEVAPPVKARQPAFNHKNLTLSASSIKSYITCPQQFEFGKIMRIPQHTSSALDLGNAIHKIAEEFSRRKKDGQEPTLDDGLKMFEKEWRSKPYRSKIDEKSAKDRIRQMTGTYLGWDSRSKNELVGTEIPFSLEIGGVRFNGKIDRLEKNPEGGYEVVDFKSGKSLLSRPKARIDPQLNIYAKAVKKMHGVLPVKASLFYLEKDKMVEYDIKRESVEESMNSIKDMVGEILKENFKATPGHVCSRCPYASICESSIIDG